LAEAGIEPSVDSTGASYHHALAETVIGRGRQRGARRHVERHRPRHPPGPGLPRRARHRARRGLRCGRANPAAEGAIVWERVDVAPGAVLRNCIVAAGARMGHGAMIEPGAVVAAGDTVPDGGCRSL